MFKTKVGYSTKTDPVQAGIDAATEAIKVGNAKLGMFFTNSNMDQIKVVQGIKSVFGNKPIIGCTTSRAIVTKDGLISGDSFVGMMSFTDDNLIVGVACAPGGENARELGKQIAREAITNAGIKRVPSFFYMVASPKEEEEYLKGIEDVIGTVPFFGNSAADNSYEGKWSIFCNDKIINDGCAVAFFYSKNEFKNMYTGAYDETNKVGVITNIEGKRKLKEIDGVPALKKYAEWIGKSESELMGGSLLTSSLFTPIGIKDPIGKITAVREPLIGNEDLSMTMSNDLAVGTAAILLSTSQDNLIKSNSEVLENLNRKMKTTPSAYFLISSCGRKLGISSRENEIYDKIKSVTGDKEFLMIFTFGEYGSCDHSANTCGGLMLSFSAFGE